MNVSATGLNVRCLNVTISIGCDCIGSLTGKALTGSRLAPKCSIEPGSIVRNALVTTSRMRTVRELETTRAFNGGKPIERNPSAMRDPGGVSGSGKAQGASNSSARSIFRRRAQ